MAAERSVAAKDLRDEVASYRANGTIVTDETLRRWERRLTAMAFPESDAATPCTCTIACIPQGITEEQTCRLQLENERDAAEMRECDHKWQDSERCRG